MVGLWGARWIHGSHLVTGRPYFCSTEWRHQMETFSALLALCAWISLVTGEFPAQRPVTQSFDVFFDLCLNKRLGKQSWSWWFGRHRAHYDVTVMIPSEGHGDMVHDESNLVCQLTARPVVIYWRNWYRCICFWLENTKHAQMNTF